MFGMGSKTIVGLDVGSSSIKAVELRRTRTGIEVAHLGLEPIAPSEPVEGGANERYFEQWQDLKRDLRMRAYLDLVSLRYERGVRRYGYSLLSP